MFAMLSLLLCTAFELYDNTELQEVKEITLYLTESFGRAVGGVRDYTAWRTEACRTKTLHLKPKDVRKKEKKKIRCLTSTETIKRERETETETDRQRQRQRDRERERERDRENV